MIPKRDIHNFKRRLECIEISLAKMDLPGNDYELIQEYRDKCFADGLSLVRVTKYMQTLKGLYNRGLCSIPNAHPENIISILAKIEREELADWTKHDYRIALRKYLEFANRNDLSILVKIPNTHNHKLPEELLTPDDIDRLMNATKNVMQHAIIISLYESGCRISELLGLQRKHIQYDQIGAILIVDGKTGMRRIRLIEAAPYLDEWISERSFKPDDLIFPISYKSFSKILHTLAVHAKIEKRVYPHLFRHSRATFLASYLTEAQLCAYHGWTVGSPMPRIYVHLRSKDLDSTLMNVPRVLTKSFHNPCEYFQANPIKQKIPKLLEIKNKNKK